MDTRLDEWNQPPREKKCSHDLSYRDECKKCRRRPTGYTDYTCASCFAIEAAPPVEEESRYLCHSCFDAFKRDLARKESPPKLTFIENEGKNGEYDTLHYDEPEEHEAIYAAAGSGAALYIVSFSVYARAPGLVQNRRVFEEHMARLRALLFETAEPYMHKIGLSDVDLRNWEAKGRWALRIVRQYEIFEVLPSGLERPTDGRLMNRKWAVERGSTLAKETGLMHRLWPVLKPTGNYRNEPPKYPKDERCDIFPDGRAPVWQRFAENLPGAPEDED